MKSHIFKWWHKSNQYTLTNNESPVWVWVSDIDKLIWPWGKSHMTDSLRTAVVLFQGGKLITAISVLFYRVTLCLTLTHSHTNTKQHMMHKQTQTHLRWVVSLLLSVLKRMKGRKVCSLDTSLQDKYRKGDVTPSELAWTPVTLTLTLSRWVSACTHECGNYTFMCVCECVCVCVHG